MGCKAADSSGSARWRRLLRAERPIDRPRDAPGGTGSSPFQPGWRNAITRSRASANTGVRPRAGSPCARIAARARYPAVLKGGLAGFPEGDVVEAAEAELAR